MSQKKLILGLTILPPSQADLDDHDLGLTFEKVRAHQVLVQDLGEDPEHDRDESQNDFTNLKFVSDFTPKKKSKETS